jgi:hypothetical protein
MPGDGRDRAREPAPIRPLVPCDDAGPAPFLGSLAANFCAADIQAFTLPVVKEARASRFLPICP